jgi:hypothetical protein
MKGVEALYQKYSSYLSEFYKKEKIKEKFGNGELFKSVSNL